LSNLGTEDTLPFLIIMVKEGDCDRQVRYFVEK
jgi:hypothetical protein